MEVSSTRKRNSRYLVVIWENELKDYTIVNQCEFLAILCAQISFSVWPVEDLAKTIYYFNESKDNLSPNLFEIANQNIQEKPTIFVNWSPHDA